MNIRTIGFALGAALVASISTASPEGDALNACARAFVASIAAPGGSPPAYKIDYRDESFSDSLAQYYVREYNFDLQAQDSHSGTTVARATCTTNVRGAVIALSTLPLDARTASLAARLR